MRRGAAIILALAMLGAVPFARADEADDSENFFSENPPPADESEDFFGDAPAAASGFQSSGRLEGELWQKFAFDTRDNGHDELLNTSLSVAKAEGTFNLSPAFSVRLGALATYDLSWNEDEEVGRYRPDLWEAYATYRLGPVDFYAGHKIWAWGLMDLISPTDMINPIDLSRVFDIEMNLFKLPVASGGAAWYLGDFRLEGVVLPFFRASRFEIVGSDTALLGHRFPFYDVVRTLDDEKGYRQVARFLDRWFPNWQDRLQEELDDPDLYATHFEDMEDDFTSAGGAVRFGGSKGGWDFDLMGYYLWDQTPTIYINPKLRDLLDELRETPEGYRPIPDPRDLPASMLTDPFAAVYHRVYGPGFDVGTTFGSFGVRVEGTAIFNRRTYRKDLTPVVKPVYTYAANVEYNFPNERVLTAALIHSFIGDYDGDLIGEPTYPLLLVAWRASFFRERLETEGAFAYDFSALDNRQWRDGDIFGEDGQVSPVFTWKLTDPVHVGAGANLFWGDDGSLFGFMKSRSRVFTFANYNF